MATWLEIASDDFSAAKSLETNKFYRAAVNRYYYAVFHLITGELIRLGGQASFHLSRPTPGHRELPTLIDQVLKHLSQRKRAALASAVVILYRRREYADYTRSDFDEQYCKECRVFLLRAANLLGMQL